MSAGPRGSDLSGGSAGVFIRALGIPLLGSFSSPPTQQKDTFSRLPNELVHRIFAHCLHQHLRRHPAHTLLRLARVNLRFATVARPLIFAYFCPQYWWRIPDFLRLLLQRPELQPYVRRVELIFDFDDDLLDLADSRPPAIDWAVVDNGGFNIEDYDCYGDDEDADEAIHERIQEAIHLEGISELQLFASAERMQRLYKPPPPFHIPPCKPALSRRQVRSDHRLFHLATFKLGLGSGNEVFETFSKDYDFHRSYYIAHVVLLLLYHLPSLRHLKVIVRNFEKMKPFFEYILSTARKPLIYPSIPALRSLKTYEIFHFYLGGLDRQPNAYNPADDLTYVLPFLRQPKLHTVRISGTRILSPVPYIDTWYSTSAQHSNVRKIVLENVGFGHRHVRLLPTLAGNAHIEELEFAQTQNNDQCFPMLFADALSSTVRASLRCLRIEVRNALGSHIQKPTRETLGRYLSSFPVLEELRVPVEWLVTYQGGDATAYAYWSKEKDGVDVPSEPLLAEMLPESIRELALTTTFAGNVVRLIKEGGNQQWPALEAVAEMLDGRGVKGLRRIWLQREIVMNTEETGKVWDKQVWERVMIAAEKRGVSVEVGA